MDKSDLPLSFGVFKPVGHAVLALRSEHDLLATINALLAQGFARATLVSYSPSEMMAQVDAELPTASPLAAMGQELNLIKAHRALAAAGCHFLIVPAGDQALAGRVAAVARATGAVTAQLYGRFIIEELISTPSSVPQVFESPDRGLDLALPKADPR